MTTETCWKIDFKIPFTRVASRTTNPLGISVKGAQERVPTLKSTNMADSKTPSINGESAGPEALANAKISTGGWTIDRGPSTRWKLLSSNKNKPRYPIGRLSLQHIMLETRGRWQPQARTWCEITFGWISGRRKSNCMDSKQDPGPLLSDRHLPFSTDEMTHYICQNSKRALKMGAYHAWSWGSGHSETALCVCHEDLESPAHVCHENIPNSCKHVKKGFHFLSLTLEPTQELFVLFILLNAYYSWGPLQLHHYIYIFVH